MTPTPIQKSNAYGQFFCNTKSERLNNVMWDLVYSHSNDPLYVQVYNSRINTVESLSLTSILRDLMFNYMYPFPDKSVNCCNQINLYGFYFVSASIYYLIQEYWNEISTNGFTVNTTVNTKYENCDNNSQENNTDYQNEFYIGEWNMENAYEPPCRRPCVNVN
jgi:hypothetical protein